MYNEVSVHSCNKKSRKDSVSPPSVSVVFSTAQEQHEVQKNTTCDVTQTPVGGQMVGCLRPAGSEAAAAPWLLFRSSASTSPAQRAPDSELRGAGRRSSGTDPLRTDPGPAAQTSTLNPDERPSGSDAARLEQSEGCGREHHTELRSTEKEARCLQHKVPVICL